MARYDNRTSDAASIAVPLCDRVFPPRRRPKRNNCAYLPTELKLATLQCMEKYQLKCMRLVSKDWSTLATPLLFDKVYISSRGQDVEVFDKITSHPLLGSMVKELVYDTSRFEYAISRADYFDRLCDDLRECYVDHNEDLEWPSDHLITALRSTHSRREIYDRYSKDDFVSKGLGEWRCQALAERGADKWDALHTSLCRGIKKLGKLRSFAIVGNLWQTHLNQSFSLKKDFSGSPSVRRWNPLYARPREETDREPSEVTLISVVIALKSPLGIESLSIFEGMVNCGYSLVPSALKQWAGCSVFTGFLETCANYKSFSLTLETDGNDDYTGSRALSVLPRILYRMKNLKRLDLGLLIYCPLSYDAIDAFYTYEQVFPQEGRWLQLEDLKIVGLAIGGYQLVRMLAIRFPKVQRLYLSRIELVDGFWEGVIEGLRHNLQLKSLTLSCPTQRIGVPFQRIEMEYPDPRDMSLHRLEEYVVSGGKHPCLPWEAPAEDARQFFLDLRPHGKGLNR